MEIDNDGQQQAEEYRRWLADEEAQREYHEYLALVEQINRAFDSVFGANDEQP